LAGRRARAPGRRGLHHSLDEGRRHAATVIASAGEAGALYGAFHWLRLVQTRQPLADPDIAERPRLERRLLIIGTISTAARARICGTIAVVAGSRRPAPARLRARERIDRHQRRCRQQRQRESRSLTTPLIEQAARIADVLRPYRIRVYLAANFAAPKMLGALTTNDPLDSGGRPVVEGTGRRGLPPDSRLRRLRRQSQQRRTARTAGLRPHHADGANMLADAVGPHGGIVMWRAFVYDADVDPDRVKRAYTEFVPLDGRFRENVFAR